MNTKEKKTIMEGAQQSAKTSVQACVRCTKKHLSCSFTKGDKAVICRQCLNSGVECHGKVSNQGRQNDLHKQKHKPTIKSFIKTNAFLKLGSDTEAAAWCIVRKLHRSKFNSKCGVMVTVDSAYGNDKLPNISSRKALRNYFGEAVPGGRGASKMTHERRAYGNGFGKTSVGIPERLVFFL